MPRTAARRRRALDPVPVGVQVLKAVVLTIVCALVVLPFVGIVSTSLATQRDVNSGGGFVLLPSSVSWQAYASIFSGGVVTRAVLVSAGVTAAGTGISLVGSTLLAYGLSRPGSFGHKPLLLVVLLTLLFAPGLIPNYLIVKQLGLLDHLMSLILPVAINAFNVIVLRAFFMGIPQELLESARIDGAGELTVLARVVLPLSKAVLAVVGLFYAVGYWNAFFNALLYIDDTAKWPLQLVLRTYVIGSTQLGRGDLGATTEVLPPQPAIQMAIVVISVVPILAAYPFLQRHFAKGVLTGAVKG